jgi:hypothetical protein
MDNTGRVYSGLRVLCTMPELLTSFELILLLGLFSFFPPPFAVIVTDSFACSLVLSLLYDSPRHRRY